MRGRSYICVCVSGYLTFTTRTLSWFSFPETFRNLWMGGMFRAGDEGEGVIKTGSRHKLVNVKSVYFRKAKKSAEGLSVPERHAAGRRRAWSVATRIKRKLFLFLLKAPHPFRSFLWGLSQTGIRTKSKGFGETFNLIFLLIGQRFYQ